MSKAIETAVKVGLTIFAVTTGLALLGIGGVAGATGAFFLGVKTSTLALMSGASILAQGLMSKGIDAVGENFGSKVSTRTATAPRQIIYGKARVGGTITHIETSGTDKY